MNLNPTVFVVDDDNAVRESLIFLIKTAGLNVEAFPNALAFLDFYDPNYPGCLVLDLQMPGMSGADLQIELHRREFELPVIFLTAHGDIPASVRAIKAGAVDFLTKPVQSQELLERIQASILQDVLRCERMRHSSEKRLANLSPRELEIAALLLEGLSNKEIARQLGISHRTVETHRANVMEKTHSTNLIELARLVEHHAESRKADHRSVGQPAPEWVDKVDMSA